MGYDCAQMKKPVRTLFLTHAADLGGAERSLLEILERMDRSLVAPSLCSLSQGPLLDAARGAGVPVHALPAPESVTGMKRGALGLSPDAALKSLRLAAESLPVVRGIARAARADRAQVIYTNSAKAHILGGLAGRAAGLPVIWHMRDFFEQPTARTLFQTAARVLARAVICNSEFTAHPFRAHPGCRAVLNGLPADNVRALRPAAEVRAALGIASHAPVAGTAGRLDHWKGIPTFLDAAALAARQVPDARFIVAGGALYHRPEYKASLELRAAAPDLQGLVTFTGFRADVYDIIAAMDIYVHPSDRPEPFGRGIVEAMLLDKPVIASRHGGPLEIVSHNETGLLFEPENAGDLARAMVSLFRDATTRASMGRAGRARALDHFTIERMLPQLIQIIEETVS